jgi:hypothetical protein
MKSRQEAPSSDGTERRSDATGVQARKLSDGEGERRPEVILRQAKERGDDERADRVRIDSSRRLSC